jgi:cation diffusion facilitator family transporter
MAAHTHTRAGHSPPAGHSDSTLAVIAAMIANFAIACGKLVAGLMTGSAAMLAEAGHSVADTVNQVFLLVGIRLSNTTADDNHPHGYGKEAFFWSFLAAIFIFVAGATFSFYEGLRTAIESHEHERTSTELAVAFGVLGFAVVFEAGSFIVAVRGLLAGARRRGWGLPRYIRESPDVTIKTVFFEDSAALTGLFIALGGLSMSEATGSENWDAAASIAIGFVLLGVSLMLGMQSRNLLLGAAAPRETRDQLLRIVDAFPEVERIARLLTMQLGSHSVLVTGELRIRRDLTTAEIEDLIRRIDTRIVAEVPEVRETFWELSSTEDVILAPSAHPGPAEASG